MATVMISGGTGLIGQALCKVLVEKNYHVIILTRRKPKENVSNKVSFAEWDPEKRIINEEIFSHIDYIIHLAGANVAEKRWTEKRKNEIVTSRVKTGQLLAECIAKYPGKVKAVISASAIGWYGADAVIPNPHPFNEEAPPDNDFLGSTCKKWENAISGVKETGTRLSILRTGIVLSNKGGAFTEFRKAIKLNIVPVLGSGKQMISWIHIDDLVRIYIYALENEKLRGVYNAVAPVPVSNKQLMKTLGSSLIKHSISVHIPSLLIKMLLGEISVEVLKSCTVSSEKIQKHNFQFLYPTIESAIEDLTK
jgi:uncharacterized protein (TIGR01777 family)